MGRCSELKKLIELIDMLDKLKSILGFKQGKSLYIRPLKERDIHDVLQIEKQVYSYPWSDTVFKDCLLAGYSNWTYIKDGELIGYAVVSIAAGEAHILNICLSPIFQGQGLGRELLKELFKVAEDKKVSCIFLEVRPSNIAAINLYKDMGFKQIGERKNYYPSEGGREDGLVFSYDLLSAAI